MIERAASSNERVSELSRKNEGAASVTEETLPFLTSLFPPLRFRPFPPFFSSSASSPSSSHVNSSSKFSSPSEKKNLQGLVFFLLRKKKLAVLNFRNCSPTQTAHDGSSCAGLGIGTLASGRRRPRGVAGGRGRPGERQEFSFFEMEEFNFFRAARAPRLVDAKRGEGKNLERENFFPPLIPSHEKKKTFKKNITKKSDLAQPLGSHRLRL